MMSMKILENLPQRIAHSESSICSYVVYQITHEHAELSEWPVQCARGRSSIFYTLINILHLNTRYSILHCQVHPMIGKTYSTDLENLEIFFPV